MGVSLPGRQRCAAVVGRGGTALAGSSVISWRRRGLIRAGAHPVSPLRSQFLLPVTHLLPLTHRAPIHLPLLTPHHS